MAQILSPGVAQAVFSGTLESQPWAVVTHWSYPGTPTDWTPTNIQALADQLSAGWDLHVKQHMAVTRQLSAVDTVDIGSATPAVGSNSIVRLGTATAAGIPNTSTCTLISMHIASRYRGGHPRMYLPIGTASDTVNDYSWSAAYCTTVQNDWAALVNAVRAGMPSVGGNAINQVAVRYTYTYVEDVLHHKWHKVRSGLVNGSPFTIGQYLCQPGFGTQRRRLTNV